MEYFTVFRPDGSCFVGSGMDGTVANFQPPLGHFIFLCTQAQFEAGGMLLADAKAALVAQVDTAAENAREKVITGGAGQAMTYMAKNAEALAWLANSATPTPFLSTEAAAIGSTVAALVLEVRDQAIAWQSKGAAIEAARRKAKTDIAAATIIGDIYDAANVDWQAVLEA